MNKKFWAQFLLVPAATLAVLPATISCTNADENTTRTAELDQALRNSVNHFKNLFYQNTATTATDARVKTMVKSALGPAQNLGFTTTLEALSEKESEDADNEAGTKEVRLTVSRSDGLKKSQRITIKGFLTTAQEAAERGDKDLLITQLSEIPTHQVHLETKLINRTAREAMELLRRDATENTLDKIIQINNPKPSPFVTERTLRGQLFQTQKPTGVNISIFNVRPVTLGNLELNALNVVIQLQKGAKFSRFAQILITGFAPNPALQSLKKLQAWADVFATINNPLQAGLNGVLIPYPSEIKSLHDLAPFLKPGYNDYGEIAVELTDNISNQNDQLGSIDIEAKFRYKNSYETATIAKVIRLYGFKTTS